MSSNKQIAHRSADDLSMKSFIPQSYSPLHIKLQTTQFFLSFNYGQFGENWDKYTTEENILYQKNEVSFTHFWGANEKERFEANTKNGMCSEQHSSLLL